MPTDPPRKPPTPRLKVLDPSIAPALYAWVGEGELGEGYIGLKQFLLQGVPVPLVVVEHHRERAEWATEALREQATDFGKTIRLVKFVPVEVIEELEP